jgi:hypothetical protein
MLVGKLETESLHPGTREVTSKKEITDKFVKCLK